MGRGQKRSWGGGGGRGGGRGGNQWQQDKRPKKDYLTRDDMNNAAFEEYYRVQDIVPEGEWGAFMATLRRPLPVTFRINGSGKFADHLRDKLQSDFFAKLGSGELTVDGEPITPPRQLPWYPHGYAWQLEFSRNQLRKLPLLEAIHNFVKSANEAGSISRQEAVSMVPPLFLDVQPQHKVLDMCAAPGSKTFQLLEALHSGCHSGETPPGFVVANDADFMRCNLLTHQTKRVCSPCLMVTNHDASRFPLHLAGLPPALAVAGAALEVAAAAVTDAAPAANGAVAANGSSNGSSRPVRMEVRFDRILADVPCSGDGTLRKSPDIWRRWNISGGNSLHSIQLRIAMHGAKLLEVGGRMVYSTCTFNPVEDEAVVAELLLQCGGAMELCDVGDCLPGLRRMPGKHSWKVRDRNRFYDSWDEARDVCYKLEPTMFPSPAKAALPLERCMRFLPHHGDTGGFFVAVLRKVAELPTGGARVDKAGEKEEEEEGAAVPPEGGAGSEEGAQGEEAEAMEGLQEEVEEKEAGAAPAEAAPGVAEAEVVAPVDVARAAAEAAVAAAESSLTALEAGDLPGAMQAAAAAEAAARRAGAATHQRQQRAAGQQHRQQQDGPRNPRGGKHQQLQQLPQPPPQDPPEAAADGEGGEGETGTSAQLAQVSWIRGGGGRGRPDGGKWAYIDPVAPLEDEVVLGALYDYYGIPSSFPLRRQLVMRSLDRQPKRLYWVADGVLRMLHADSREGLKVVSTGLKVFERQLIRDQVNECPYRLSQEGLPLVLPHITRQRLSLPAELMLLLLRERNLILPGAVAEGGGEGEVGAGTTAAGNPRGTKPALTHPAVLAALEPLKLGCVVCELAVEDARRLGFAAATTCAGGAEKEEAGVVEEEDATGGLAANAPLAVVGWKGKASLAIMVERAECAQMIDKLEEELKKLSTNGSS